MASASNAPTTPIDIYKPLYMNQRVRLTTSDPFVPTFVTSKLGSANDPTEIYAKRVHDHKIVLENPAKDSRRKKEQEEKNKRRKKHDDKKKLGLISKRKAKERGLWSFEKSQTKFKLFLPLHNLWMGYMSELLGLQQPSSTGAAPSPKEMPSSGGMHAKLVKADFHGSIITVRKSKNPALLDRSGIIIHETEGTFKIITKDDKIKVIPKRNSIFIFAVPLYSTLPPSHTAANPLPIPTSSSTVLEVPHIEFELYGNQFMFRSADRASRKFKHKETIEL